MSNQIETLTDKVIYTGKTHTTGGREGASHSDDGRLTIQLSSPGSSGKGTNPEQLFAAGWSACFIGALGKSALKRKITFPKDTAVDAEVDLVASGESYRLRARLNISLPGLDRKVAQELVEAAHQTCPYSKMTKGNVEVDLNVI